MEAKKSLWGCGHPRGSSSFSKKKRSSKKKCSESSMDDDHVKFTTSSLIKYVKKRCSSLTANERKKRQIIAAAQSKSKSQHYRKGKIAATTAAATVNEVSTLRDWMLENSPAELSVGSSGEFHVFYKKSCSNKKIHPAAAAAETAAERMNPEDFGSPSRKKSYYNMDQILEKLDSVDGEGTDRDGGETAEVASSSPPHHQSARDDDIIGKKRVTFTLPIVSKVFI